MIKLRPKGQCKRKEFNRALSVGSYVYLEFMNPKTGKHWYGKIEDNWRKMTPRPKILKVISKNELELAYLYDEKEDKWRAWYEKIDEDHRRGQNLWYEPTKPQRCVYKAWNIWSWFQKDEVRNIRSMTKEELIKEYLMELI